MPWNRATCLIVIVSFFFSGAFGQSQKADPESFRPVELFDEVWQLSIDNFYNPPTIPDWNVLRAKYRPMIGKANSPDEASKTINMMLAELNASHTHLYTRADWEYYDLMEIFKVAFEERVNELFPNGRITYPNIGIFTRNVRGRTFVKAVLDGGPAVKAGIVAGDEIRSIDGERYHEVSSFFGKTKVAVRIRRSNDPASEKDIEIIPEERGSFERYMDAMKASVRIVQEGNHQIGYIHIWSFTSEQYYLQLLEEIQHGKLKDAAGLILDLRDGWGGANPYYLSPFDPRVPTEVPSGKDKNETIDFKWKKPVVILINEGSRSGKESLVYAFKLARLGKLVGTTTAGAGLPGRPYLLRDGSLLLLAHQRPQGYKVSKAIEGKGVSPDIYVKFPLEYAAGNDPQLKAAIKAAAESIRSSAKIR